MRVVNKGDATVDELKKVLTWEDVEQEADKVQSFFERLPEEMRPSAESPHAKR